LQAIPDETEMGISDFNVLYGAYDQGYENCLCGFDAKLNKSTETRMKQSVLLTTLDLNMTEKVKGLKECESAFSLNGNRAKDVFAEDGVNTSLDNYLPVLLLN
tara:strand:+ start:243 stop:551 length:309 start_codon:yes stop_codon:yes gene_type:complete